MNANEEEMFKKIVESMGITKYDSMLVSALNEYAIRLATEILCDATDYSIYAGRKEINSDDVKLAIKLNDSAVILGTEDKSKCIADAQSVVNKQDIMSKRDVNAAYQPRYPTNHQDNYTQRCFTFVPGIEAYGDDIKSLKEGASVAQGGLTKDSVNSGYTPKSNASHSNIDVTSSNTSGINMKIKAASRKREIREIDDDNI